MARHFIALIIGAAALMSVVANGQAPAPTPVAFDVVSIRPSAKDGKGIYVNLLPSGIYTARNMPLSALISAAYGYGLTVIGAPDWDTAQFDISAKTETPKPGIQQRQLIRSLLADRFKFVAHMETREMPVYALVIARPDRKLGPMLRPAQGCDSTATRVARPPSGPLSPDQLPTCGASFNQMRQNVGNMPLAALVINLPRSSIDRPVLDRTASLETSIGICSGKTIRPRRAQASRSSQRCRNSSA